MSLKKFIALVALAIILGSASGLGVHIAFQIGHQIGSNTATQQQQ